VFILLFAELYVSTQCQLLNHFTLSFLVVIKDIEKGLGQVDSDTKDLQQLQLDSNKLKVIICCNINVTY